MNNKTLIILFFVVACIFQWYVPLSMITGQEAIIKTGNSFKFETRPIDPNDPFRGKYIHLSFKAIDYRVDNLSIYERNQPAFVIIENDSIGFAKIKDIVLEAPTFTDDYIKAIVHPMKRDSLLRVDYPFNKFYMDEFKALPAEKIYRDVQQDSTRICYAIVKVSKGETALLDVIIDDIPIKDAVEASRNNN